MPSIFAMVAIPFVSDEVGDGAPGAGGVVTTGPVMSGPFVSGAGSSDCANAVADESAMQIESATAPIRNRTLGRLVQLGLKVTSAPSLQAVRW